MAAYQIFYEGHVQGVGFRFATKQTATGFDVTGWIRNLPDGRVELFVQGEDDEVHTFLNELENDGALAGNIRHAERHPTTPSQDISGFSIR